MICGKLLITKVVRRILNYDGICCKVKYTSICIAHFYANRLKCAQTWITQFYLQITPCLPLLPSRRTSPPFGWYSCYRPTEGRRLSRPGWLVTYRNKVPPRESPWARVPVLKPVCILALSFGTHCTYYRYLFHLVKPVAFVF